ncbi:MAG: ion transporter [Candidatus Aenigmatarchaeota archaeon]
MQIKDFFWAEGSKEYIIFNDIISIIILVSIFLIILETIPDFWDKYQKYFIFSEILFTSIFTIEYILRILTTKRKIEYVISIFGIIDFLSVLAGYLFLLGLKNYAVLRSFRLLRILRLLRIIRCIYPVIENRKKLAKAFDEVSFRNIELCIFSFFVTIIIGGSIFYILEADIPNSKIKNMIDGIWLSAQTVTTIGYGDIVPISPISKFIAIVLAIVGYALFSFLVIITYRFVRVLLFE